MNTNLTARSIGGGQPAGRLGGSLSAIPSRPPQGSAQSYGFSQPSNFKEGLHNPFVQPPPPRTIYRQPPPHTSYEHPPPDFGSRLSPLDVPQNPFPPYSHPPPLSSMLYPLQQPSTSLSSSNNELPTPPSHFERPQISAPQIQPAARTRASRPQSEVILQHVSCSPLHSQRRNSENRPLM